MGKLCLANIIRLQVSQFQIDKLKQDFKLNANNKINKIQPK